VNFAVHFRHRSSPALRTAGPHSATAVRVRSVWDPFGSLVREFDADYDRGLLRIRVWDEARPEAEPRKIAIRADRPAIAEATE
jgi:hypothetical protein